MNLSPVVSGISFISLIQERVELYLGVHAYTPRLRTIVESNFPATAAIFVTLFTGQLLQLASLRILGFRDLLLVLSSLLFYSIALATVPLLVCGILVPVRNGYISATLWVLFLCLSTIYFWDHFSYQWLALHLSDSIPLLIQNVHSDFKVMRSKMAALTWVFCAYVALQVIGTLAARRIFRHFRIFRKPVPLRKLLYALSLTMLLYVTEQLVSPYVMTQEAYNSRLTVLWQPRFHTNPQARGSKPLFAIDFPQFKQVPNEAVVEKVLSTVTPDRVTHPLNIFLFVVDSFRADYVTNEITPNLFHLKERALRADNTVACANCTHISWFSILHGINPLYWSVAAHQAHSSGAIPLQILKRAGYKIHAISTPSLDYFGFAHSVFGDHTALADTILDQAQLFDPSTDDRVGDIDDKVMMRLIAEVEQIDPTKDREFYLTMLDASHHDYSWAKSYRPRATPFMEKVPLFSGQITKENVGLLKNRYQNSINFLDGLFGKFFDMLKARGLIDRSIIVVTGDHGEEFLERMHVTHSSELNSYQLRVPIIVYVPKVPPPKMGCNVASHTSIFPTILDAIGLKTEAKALLAGSSMLTDCTDSVAFSAMCSSYSPSKVLVDGGDEKMVLDFTGIGKVGKTLIARKMSGTLLHDREYREVPGNDHTKENLALRRLIKRIVREVLNDE